MKQALAIIFALVSVGAACLAEPRWCSISKRDRSNAIAYPPIALAAQVQGEARAVIIYKPNSKVEKVEHVSGAAMLSKPLEDQLMKWIAKTNESGEDLCQTHVVAIFSLHAPVRYRSRQKLKFARQQNAVIIAVSANFPWTETESKVISQDSK